MKVSNILLVLMLLPIPSLTIPGSMGSKNVFTPKQASQTTWELLGSDYPDGAFRDVAFINSTHGWVVGQENSSFSSDGIVLHTDDGGDSWYLQSSRDSQRLKALDVIDEWTLWVTGSDGNLFYTLDSGKTWNETVVMGAIGGMSTVKFINKTHGWTGNNEVLYRTIDGGQSWEAVLGWNFNDHPRMMQILTPLDIWASGYSGIYHSTNGGEIWERTSNLGGWAVSFVSETEGWVIDDSRLAHTIDGSLWSELVVPMRTPFFRLRAPYTTDIQFLDENHGWIVGTEIAVMYTPDGGANWYEQSVPADVNSLGPRITAVDFINHTHGWAVGSDGFILRTTRGDGLGNRLWHGITDPLFLAILGTGIVSLILVVLVIKRRRRTKGIPPALEP